MAKKTKKTKNETDVLVGLTVHSVMSAPSDYPKCSMSVILFNDGETYLEFEEQDYHDYHDACRSARIMEIRCDKAAWQHIAGNYHPARRWR